MSNSDSEDDITELTQQQQDKLAQLQVFNFWLLKVKTDHPVNEDSIKNRFSNQIFRLFYFTL